MTDAETPARLNTKAKSHNAITAPMLLALICQIVLLAYHQVTTLADLHPFNGVRHAQRAERFAEAGINAVLMSLSPIGFIFGIRGLMIYGVIYYFVLFAIELIIWWIPYFFAPSGAPRRIYNLLLAVATTQFTGGDALTDWTIRHRRLHGETITPLPPGRGPIRPNLEHMILHSWTLITALATLAAYSKSTS